MAGPTAFVTFRGDFGPVMRESRIAGIRAGDNMGEGFSGSLGGSLKKAGKVAAVGFAAVATAGYGAAKGIGAFVEKASDMGETLSKSNTVFGSSAGEIEAWSKTAAQSFGQSQQQALDAASTFGNLFVQLGVGADEAAKLSTAQVELASDFASFHNTSPEQAIEAMTAAYRGEYDAVQRYVPTITAAAVEQKALEMGLAGTTKELTAQDKALAVQKLLTEGAGDAAGDFDRTSGGLANTQRRLSAVWSDIQVQLGNKFLPVVTKVAGFFADNLPKAFSATGAFVPRIQAAFEALTTAFQTGEGEGFLADLGRNARQVWEFITQTAVPGIRSAFKSFVEGLQGQSDGGFFGNLGKEVMNVVRIVRDEVLPWIRDRLWPFLRDTLIPGWLRFASVMQDVWANVFHAVQTAWGFIQPILAAVWGWVVNTAIPAWGRFASVMVVVWAGVWDAITAAWRFIQPVFQAVGWYISNVLIPGWQRIWTVASTVFGWVADKVSWWWNTVTKPIFDRVWGFITTTLVPVFQSLWDKGREVFDGVAERISAWWTTASEKFDQFRLGIEFVRKWVQEKTDAIAGFFLTLVGNIGTFFTGLADTISSPFRTAFKAIADLWNNSVGSLSWETPSWLPPPFGGKMLEVPDIPTDGFNRGGPVGGPNVNRDVVPAMLTPGEYVINKDAAKQLGYPMLAALNSGRFAGFNRGGPVSAIVAQALARQRSGYNHALAAELRAKGRRGVVWFEDGNGINVDTGRILGGRPATTTSSFSSGTSSFRGGRPTTGRFSAGGTSPAAGDQQTLAVAIGREVTRQLGPVMRATEAAKNRGASREEIEADALWAQIRAGV